MLWRGINDFAQLVRCRPEYWLPSFGSVGSNFTSNIKAARQFERVFRTQPRVHHQPNANFHVRRGSVNYGMTFLIGPRPICFRRILLPTNVLHAFSWVGFDIIAFKTPTKHD